MAGDHYRQSGYVTLQDVPDPNREYVETFQNLTGGINRFDLDYRLKGNESPFMQNLSWHNGTLTSRLGQNSLGLLGTYDTVVMSAPFLYHGYLLTEVSGDSGVGIFAVKIREEGTDPEALMWSTAELMLTSTQTDDPPVGTFVQYREDVFFKAKGLFGKVSWDYTTDRLTIKDSRQDAFVPTLQIDANPATGIGQTYQQINRLSLYRKVEYKANGQATFFKFPEQEHIRPNYPLTVTVDGVNKAVVGYSSGNELGVVLENAPAQDTAVVVQYALDESQASDTLMDTSTAIVFGGAQELCLVLGGPSAQPNAYFWSGIDGIVMNPLYFPDDQWNLAGEVNAPITAFGKQQNMMVVFQPNAVGRAVFGTETVGGLVRVTMNYTRINAEIGCDLPGSLQLVENNLVWCSRKYGVCRLKDSSAAYENNITVISRKINGDYRLAGLLEQLKSVADDEVCSVDTGKRYILVLGDDDGRAYEWNYELSEHSNPSWFYHTHIVGIGFIPLPGDVLYEVSNDENLAQLLSFEPIFEDYTYTAHTAINKVYRFPPRDFGSYDRLKNIKSMLFQTRGDYKTNTQIAYRCDYGSRVDATNLVVVPPAGATQGSFAKNFRRKPGYHNIHHLGIELSNNTAGDDLNLISAQIFYEYRGRTR